MELFEIFIRTAQVVLYWPEQDWYAVKQNNQPNNQQTKHLEE